MTKREASELTRAIWESRRAEMVRWLIQEKNFKTEAAANRAVTSFIETMAFVAINTGRPEVPGRKAG